MLTTGNPVGTSCSWITKCDRGEKEETRPTISFRGFTLIETLVAISILAVSLVVILQLFSGALKSSEVSDEYTRGIFHARDKMDEILLANQLNEGVLTGQFEDGFRWRAEARKHMDIKEAKDVWLPFSAFKIDVQVAWDTGGRERRFTISAIKLVQAGEFL